MLNKKEKIYYLAIGLAIALIISLLVNSIYIKTPVRDQQISFNNDDIFTYNKIQYKIIYYPEGKLGLVTEPSIKIYSIPWNHNDVIIPIQNCLNSCDYKNFRIKIETINENTIYYYAYYFEMFNITKGILNKTTIFTAAVLLIVLLYSYFAIGHKSEKPDKPEKSDKEKNLIKLKMKKNSNLINQKPF